MRCSCRAAPRQSRHGFHYRAFFRACPVSSHINRREIAKSSSHRTNDPRRCSAAALVLEHNPGQLPRETLANQPGDLEGGLIIAQSFTMDIGDAVTLRIGTANL